MPVDLQQLAELLGIAGSGPVRAVRPAIVRCSCFVLNATGQFHGDGDPILRFDAGFCPSFSLGNGLEPITAARVCNLQHGIGGFVRFFMLAAGFGQGAGNDCRRCRRLPIDHDVVRRT